MVYFNARETWDTMNEIYFDGLRVVELANVDL